MVTLRVVIELTEEEADKLQLSQCIEINKFGVVVERRRLNRPGQFKSTYLWIGDVYVHKNRRDMDGKD